MRREIRRAVLASAVGLASVGGAATIVDSTIGIPGLPVRAAPTAEFGPNQSFVDITPLPTSAPNSPHPTTGPEAQIDRTSCVPTELEYPEVQPLFPIDPNVVPQVGNPATLTPDQAPQPENEAKLPVELLYEKVVQFAETALRNGLDGDPKVTVNKGYQRTGSNGGYFLGSIEQVNGPGDKTVITGRIDNWQTGEPELTVYGLQFSVFGDSFIVSFGFDPDMRPVASPFTSQRCDRPGLARSTTVEAALEAFQQMYDNSSLTGATAAPSTSGS